MKISADHSHPDYHQVVVFLEEVYVDGIRLKTCVHIDTKLGEAQCYTQPLKVVRGLDGVEMADTHVVKGKIDLIWRDIPTSPNGIVGDGTMKLFLHLKKDWEERELLREQAKETTCIMGGDKIDMVGYENVTLHKGNVDGPR